MSENDITPYALDVSVAPAPSGERLAALRVVDANANRAAEGLRVAEEFCRFCLNDRGLSERCKGMRHSLAEAIALLPLTELNASRNSLLDVGANVQLASEDQRESLINVAAANWQRVQQALRSIEEYGKLLSPSLSQRAKLLRYEAYTVAKACLTTEGSQQRLAAARLYVLIDGSESQSALQRHAGDLVAAGVHVIQLRDKKLSDRELLIRARTVRAVTQGTPSLFILNDRPDLALLAQADGVHVGQEELSVAEVRRIVGPTMLIGVSTHNIDQARQAVLDGASYLGCGPTFPSGTKAFAHFPGLDFLRQVAAEIGLPAFAIGGITLDNLPHVLATGFTRIAVSGAIDPAAPRQSAAALLAAIGQ